MRFLIDESLSSTVSRLLSEAGHDALHVGDLDLLGASDDAVMAAADTTGSVLVSGTPTSAGCWPWAGSQVRADPAPASGDRRARAHHARG